MINTLAAEGKLTLIAFYKELKSIQASQKQTIASLKNDKNPQVVEIVVRAQVLDEFLEALLTSISRGNVFALKPYK